MTDSLSWIRGAGSVVAVSFLLGSIPFGYLLVRLFRGQDIRQTGSGNIGATNVARTGSKGLAIATLLLDALKGFAAVALAFAFSAHTVPTPAMATIDGHSPVIVLQQAYDIAALAALCAVLGHMFTPWLRFRGGKGVATAVGAFAALAPRAVLVSLAVFVVIVAVTRYVSLGSMLGAAIFPFAACWLTPPTRSTPVVLLMAVTSLLILAKHKDNIHRLLSGTENRFR